MCLLSTMTPEGLFLIPVLLDRTRFVLSEDFPILEP